MLVRHLQLGSSFTIDLGPYGRPEFRLIYLNDCRAYVEPLKVKRLDPLDDGERGGKINISPNTVCTIVMDADLEDFIMGTTAMSVKKEVTANSSSKAAYRQERSLKQGTIRANILAAVQGGETNIEKLAKKFGTVRTNVASHIRDMWRFHGYGFTITGDVVKIVPPVGGVLKAKAAAAAKPTAKKAASKKKDPLDDDDDFLS